MLMSGFEPRISGVESDRSTNWATTTALSSYICYIIIFSHSLLVDEKMLRDKRKRGEGESGGGGTSSKS